MEYEEEVLEELYNIATEDDNCEFKIERMMEVLEKYFQDSIYEEPEYE